MASDTLEPQSNVVAIGGRMGRREMRLLGNWRRASDAQKTIIQARILAMTLTATGRSPAYAADHSARRRCAWSFSNSPRDLARRSFRTASERMRSTRCSKLAARRPKRAISGQTLQMVEHYAKARSQLKLGEAAILKWQGSGH